MEFLAKFWAYMSENWAGIIIAGGAILAAAETVVRLTPTKSDDGFVQRVANVYNKLFELTGVPNVKKEDGSFVIPAGVHPPKKDKLTLTAGKKKE
jgi:hypothetical protein